MNEIAWTVVVWIGIVATAVLFCNLAFLACLLAVYNFQQWRNERRIKKFSKQIEEHHNEPE